MPITIHTINQYISLCLSLAIHQYLLYCISIVKLWYILLQCYFCERNLSLIAIYMKYILN